MNFTGFDWSHQGQKANDLHNLETVSGHYVAVTIDPGSPSMIIVKFLFQGSLL